jgi:hypothetical protein
MLLMKLIILPGFYRGSPELARGKYGHVNAMQASRNELLAVELVNLMTRLPMAFRGNRLGKNDPFGWCPNIFSAFAPGCIDGKDVG